MVGEHPLADAVALLRELPRGRSEVEEAGRLVQHFRDAHRDVRVDLLVDQPPGSRWVDYDLLLTDSDGTVALSWRRDEGVPWSVRYTDHWAANLVLTADGTHVSVQHALLSLKLRGGEYPDMLQALVDQQLIQKAVEDDPPPVSDAELQDAADAFRIAHGLHQAEATARWLEEVGLSEARFEELARMLVQWRKLEERVTDGRVEPYFEEHREQFDSVQFFRVELGTAASAASLAASAKQRGLLTATGGAGVGVAVRGWLGTEPAHRVPSLARAAVGDVLGPMEESGRCWVAEVLARHPARLDGPTRLEIQSRLFRDWLSERRARAEVQWHWM